MSVDNAEELLSRSQALRAELKAWEVTFAAASNGRKAGREDIKKNAPIGTGIALDDVGMKIADLDGRFSLEIQGVSLSTRHPLRETAESERALGRAESTKEEENHAGEGIGADADAETRATWCHAVKTGASSGRVGSV